jgi:rSAM/selenodomain-associated transferase 2
VLSEADAVRVSVIIPTWNEAASLAGTLERIGRDAAEEVIVVDGGSTDETVRIASRYAIVIESSRGRGLQQNLGAGHATGDVLLFLHADCRLEPGWPAELRHVAGRAGFAAGAFRMAIDSRRPIYRAIERGGDLRVRWLGLPYGDQGIFVRRETFERLGGFPAVAFMEDLLFMQRVRRTGRVALLGHRIHISPRRWEQVGPIRQTIRNWALTALATGCGVHPNRLASFYPHVRTVDT